MNVALYFKDHTVYIVLVGCARRFDNSFRKSNHFKLQGNRFHLKVCVDPVINFRQIYLFEP